MANLLTALKQLKEQGPAPHNYGICTQISRHLTIRESRYMSHLMQQWPGRSGSRNYPVPASRTDRSYLAAQLKYAESNTKQMWDRNTEQGQLRWELLEWLIEELQK